MDWKRRLIGRFSWSRLMADILLVPVLAYAGLALFAWLCADRQIFLPQPCSYESSDRFITLTTPDGERLCAIYLPNPQARFTVLYSHGNAEDLGEIQPELEVLQQAGFAVFAYDYRGYGLSTGTPSVKGAGTDILTAYRYLITTLGVPARQIVLYGRSVGGGPSVQLAAAQPVGGLILQSTFTSTFVLVTKVPILPFDRFRNLALIDRIGCPLLVMHGRRDRVVPFAHGLKLYARAAAPKRALWLDNVGHNSFPGNHEQQYMTALTEFRDLLADHGPLTTDL
jgi:fermentation-respiration switch protein FrsA (DUF1100 family)